MHVMYSPIPLPPKRRHSIDRRSLSLKYAVQPRCLDRIQQPVLQSLHRWGGCRLDSYDCHRCEPRFSSTHQEIHNALLRLRVVEVTLKSANSLTASLSPALFSNSQDLTPVRPPLFSVRIWIQSTWTALRLAVHLELMVSRVLL